LFTTLILWIHRTLYVPIHHLCTVEITKASLTELFGYTGGIEFRVSWMMGRPEYFPLLAALTISIPAILHCAGVESDFKWGDPYLPTKGTCNISDDIKDEIKTYKSTAKGILDLVRKGALKSEMYKDLERLVDTTGSRFPGSSSYNEGIDAMKAEMVKMGLSNIREEPVTFPNWQRWGRRSGNSWFPERNLRISPSEYILQRGGRSLDGEAKESIHFHYWNGPLGIDSTWRDYRRNHRHPVIRVFGNQRNRSELTRWIWTKNDGNS